jgi:hypothetical protein
VAITRDHKSTIGQIGSGLSVTTSWSVNPTAGSTVIVAVLYNHVGTNLSVVDNGTTPSTFTLDASNLVSTSGIHIFRANNITLPASGSYTVTVTTSSTASTILAGGWSYLGVQTGAPEATSTASTGTSTAPSTGSVTGSAGDLYVGAFADRSALNPETITHNGGPTWTEQFRNTDGATFWPFASADAIIAGSGSNSDTWTLGDSVLWTGVIACYQPAVAVQIASPTADVSTGGWTTDTGSTTNLYQAIDEVLAVDTDYIQSPIAPANNEDKERLGPLSVPATRTGHYVDWRYEKDRAGGNRIDLTVTLYQADGTTVVETQTVTNITAAVVQGQLVVTEPDAAAIPDADYATGLVIGFKANQV